MNRVLKGSVFGVLVNDIKCSEDVSVLEGKYIE